MLGKFEFHWFFNVLMISEKFINKNNIKYDLLGVVVKYFVVQFLQKRPCVLTEIYCVLLPLSSWILFGVGGIQ